LEEGGMTKDHTPDHGPLSNESEPGYEPPSVEEVDTEDSPAVTAAGGDSDGGSDLRLKRSVRPLEETIIRSR
jgi:hypothetical protein